MAGNSFTWKSQAFVLEAAEDTVLGNAKFYGNEARTALDSRSTYCLVCYVSHLTVFDERTDMLLMFFSFSGCKSSVFGGICFFRRH